MKKCFTPVDLSVATADLVNIFRSAIQNAGLSFTINCPPLGEMVYPSLLTPSLPFLHILILLVFTSLCSCFFFLSAADISTLRCGRRSFVTLCPMHLKYDYNLVPLVIFYIYLFFFLQYTFKGEIKVVVQKSATYAEVLVSDTGVGIPEHELPHLFERVCYNPSTCALFLPPLPLLI